jgi:protein-disulfide isomerase
VRSRNALPLFVISFLVGLVSIAPINAHASPFLSRTIFSTPHAGKACPVSLVGKKEKVGTLTYTCKKVSGLAKWVAVKPAAPVKKSVPDGVTSSQGDAGAGATNQIGGGASGNNSTSPNNSNPTTATGSLTVATVGGDGVVFNFGAQHRLDIYEDMQCPWCAQFEALNGASLDSLISSGKYEVHFHVVGFLGPESIKAGNAALCSVQSGNFLAFHTYLFKHQQIVENLGLWETPFFLQAGNAVGITDTAFASCVGTLQDQQLVVDATNSSDFARTGSTPTVYLDGKQLDNGTVLLNKNGFDNTFGLNIT